MGKLICDSTTSSPVIPWKDPTTTVAPPSPIDSISAVDLSDEILTVDSTTATTWDDVSGLEDQQKRHLQRLHAKGVLWKHPKKKIQNQNQEHDDNDNDGGDATAVVFRLSHGGDVEADGNCLFTASQKAMGMTEITAKDLRRRTVRRFSEDLGSESSIDAAIKHMYSPDLKSGWGIHVVQELKLLAKKSDRQSLDLAIQELVNLGMQRYIKI